MNGWWIAAGGVVVGLVVGLAVGEGTRLHQRRVLDTYRRDLRDEKRGEPRGFGRGRPGDGGGKGHPWATEPDVGVCPDGVPARLDGGGLDAPTAQAGPGEVLPGVRQADEPPSHQRPPRGLGGVSASDLLRPGLHGSGLCQAHVAAWLEAEAGVEVPWGLLRIVWGYDESARPPHRREVGQRLAREHSDLVRELSCVPPPPCPACWADGSWEGGLARVATDVPRRVDRLRALGNAVVPQVAEVVGRRVMELAS